MMGYPSNVLFEEVAYLAYHVHWSYGDVMHLEHPERRRWVQEVRKLAEPAQGVEASGWA